MWRITGRGITAGIMGIIAGGLLLLSLFITGWYAYEGKWEYESGDYESGTQYGLSKYRDYEKGWGIYENDPYYDDESTGVYDIDEDEVYDYGEVYEDDKLAGVFSFVRILVIIGMSLAFIFAIFAFLARFRLIPGIVPLIIGIIAAIAVIIGPVYMIFTLPDAMNELYENPEGEGPWESFWGSEPEYGGETTWGPSLFWYISLCMCPLLVVASIFCIGLRRDGDDDYDEEEDDEDEEEEVDEEEYIADVFKTISPPVLSEPAQLTGDTRCIKCNKLVMPSGARFCHMCGTDQTIKDAPGPSQLGSKCTNCGEQLPSPTPKFCSSCGVPQTTAAPISPGKIPCVKCGVPLDSPDTKFCTSCGANQSSISGNF